jgi:recombinational DNA repair ATPase RecF
MTHGTELDPLESAKTPNFRCFESLDLALDEKPVFLVSENAAGKSTRASTIYIDELLAAFEARCE